MVESTTFCLTLHLIREAVRITNKPVDLSTVPLEYHKFAYVFNKAKTETLALYYQYDLQIKLENGEKLPIRTIYSLSTTKQEAFKKFISENFNTGFIQPTYFPYRD